MKTNVTATSVRAFHQLEGKQTLHVKILALLSTSLLKGLTINEIANRLNLERSTVSARLNELKKMEHFIWNNKLSRLYLVATRKSMESKVQGEAWGIQDATQPTQLKLFEK